MKHAIYAILILLAGAAQGAELPINSTFTLDTPGGPPAYGGKHQPTFVTGLSGGTVEHQAFGIKSNVMRLGPLQHLRYHFPRVSTGVLTMRFTLALETSAYNSPVMIFGSCWASQGGIDARGWSNTIEGPGFSTYLGPADEPNTIIVTVYPERGYWTAHNPEYGQPTIIHDLKNQIPECSNSVDTITFWHVEAGMAVDNISITWSTSP